MFILGIEANVAVPIPVATDLANFRLTTVSHLRQLINQKWPHVASDAHSLRMLFEGRQLENLRDGVDATLEDYNVQTNSIILTQLRGGSRRTERVPVPPENLQRMHEVYSSGFPLAFTTTEPDAILGMSDPEDQPRIIMSCGHAVDPNSLTAWCRSLLDKEQFEFYCPAIVDGTTRCEKVWEYSEVRTVALLNEAEQQYFETKMSEFAALQYCDMKECPGCRSFVERSDRTNLRVRCSVCTNKNGKIFDFCWNCDAEWTGPRTSSLKCGKDDCEHPEYPAIRDAPEVTLENLPEDIRVPNRRACPTCGRVVEHNMQACKYIVCPRCRNEFCFLCLLPKRVCMLSAPFSWYGRCMKPVAPKQTSIPVWSNDLSWRCVLL